MYNPQRVTFLKNRCSATIYLAAYYYYHYTYVLCVAVKLVTDYELRTRYDKTFNEIKVLEDCGHYKTVYW